MKNIFLLLVLGCLSSCVFFEQGICDRGQFKSLKGLIEGDWEFKKRHPVTNLLMSVDLNVKYAPGNGSQGDYIFHISESNGATSTYSGDVCSVSGDFSKEVLVTLNTEFDDPSILKIWMIGGSSQYQVAIAKLDLNYEEPDGMAGLYYIGNTVMNSHVTYEYFNNHVEWEYQGQMRRK